MSKKRIDTDAILSAHKITNFIHHNAIVACGIFILSYFTVRFVNPFQMDLAQSLLFVLYVCIVLFYARCYFPLTRQHYKIGGFILLCCIPNVLYDNYFLKFLNCGFIMMLLGYFLLHVSHKRIDSTGKYIYLDIINSMLHVPFVGLKKFLHEISSLTKETLHVRHLTGILLGIIITIPLLFVILPLLTSANTSFRLMIFTIFSDMDQIIVEILHFIFAIPVFLYLYTFVYAPMNCDKKETLRIEKDRLDQKMNSIAKVPLSIPLTMQCILILLYALFLCIFVTDILQNLNMSLQDFSYSQFAREGFFQLCVISSINLLIITFIQVFTNKQASRMYVVCKRILCIETLLLLCSASMKMVLYIYAYGLTQLRVYSSWFLLVLLGVFFLILMYTNRKEEGVILRIAIYFSICFFLLNIINVEKFIETYNETMPIAEQQYYLVYD